MNKTIADLALTLKQLVESIHQGSSRLYESLQRVLELELDINVQDSIKYVKSIDNIKIEYKKEIEKLKSELDY